MSLEACFESVNRGGQSQFLKQSVQQNNNNTRVCRLAWEKDHTQALYIQSCPNETCHWSCRLTQSTVVLCFVGRADPPDRNDKDSEAVLQASVAGVSTWSQVVKLLLLHTVTSDCSVIRTKKWGTPDWSDPVVSLCFSLRLLSIIFPFFLLSFFSLCFSLNLHLFLNSIFFPGRWSHGRGPVMVIMRYENSYFLSLVISWLTKL